MSRRVLAHLRGRIAAGILLLLPLLITLWLVRFLFGVITNNVTPSVLLVLELVGVPHLETRAARFVIPLIGVVLTAVFLYLFGLLVGNYAGRRVWELVEAGILRIPLVKGVYGAARQLLDAFRVGAGGGFSRVVLVEYPRLGIWTIGFVTNDRENRVGRSEEKESTLAVFLPTTPNPTSGWVALIPRKDVLVIDISVEEGMKLVVSGGIVMPEDLGPRLAPWGASHERASGP